MKSCVEHFDAEPHGKEGQPFQWVDVQDLSDLDFPQANAAIVDRLLARHAEQRA